MLTKRCGNNINGIKDPPSANSVAYIASKKPRVSVNQNALIPIIMRRVKEIKRASTIMKKLTVSNRGLVVMIYLS